MLPCSACLAVIAIKPCMPAPLPFAVSLVNANTIPWKPGSNNNSSLNKRSSRGSLGYFGASHGVGNLVPVHEGSPGLQDLFNRLEQGSTLHREICKHTGEILVREVREVFERTVDEEALRTKSAAPIIPTAPGSGPWRLRARAQRHNTTPFTSACRLENRPAWLLNNCAESLIGRSTYIPHSQKTDNQAAGVSG